MKGAGGCHCGAIRYQVSGDPVFSAVCHCHDCRANSGAVAVAWISFPATALAVIRGRTVEYASSENVQRHFCGTCGTGLFYFNEEFLPGLVDIQLTTFDHAADIPPQMHLQMAEALPWEDQLGLLPRFDRYPQAFTHYH